MGKINNKIIFKSSWLSFVKNWIFFRDRIVCNDKGIRIIHPKFIIKPKEIYFDYSLIVGIETERPIIGFSKIFILTAGGSKIAVGFWKSDAEKIKNIIDKKGIGE